MDMKLNEEQVQLRDMARKFMENECTGDFIREIEEKSETGFSAKMWGQMAEMGWLGLALPEAYGGYGLGFVDQVVLTKELGRMICPSPYLYTAVIGGEAIARAGNDEQKETLLPKVAGGECIIAFGYQEHGRDFSPGALQFRARAAGDGYVLDGKKMFVEFASGADLLLVVARTSGEPPAAKGLTLFLVDTNRPGITLKHLPTMARDRQYEVIFEGVKVPTTAVLGKVDEAWSCLEGVVEKAAVVHSAYCVGVAEKMHEYATEFAKQRVQFGRPIGQMQIIQQYLAGLIIEIYGADTLTYYTAWNMEMGRPCRELVAKTKAFAAETVKRTTDVGSQIFGGMGYMEESNTTQQLRRGKQLQLSFGGVDYWEKIVAEEMFDR